MSISNLDDFKALEPFFAIIERGLDGLVDGDHFFDLLADDIVMEFVITVPGYPKRVAGRVSLAELYRSYGDTIILERGSDLVVHHDRDTSVVVLEYTMHGHIIATGRPYTNRFVSVIAIQDRKVTHWRDYLDPLAVFEALGTNVPV